MIKNRRPMCQIYLITPPKIEPVAFRETLASALDADNVGAVQLRLKESSDDQIKRAVELLLPITTNYDVPLIMNDRPDLAAVTGCDGVHIGQHDCDYSTARATLGKDRVVGVTCHNSKHLAMVAGERGADYVAFGAFFHTSTKDTKFIAEPKIISWWTETMLIPVVAIGGITQHNCPPIVQAGSDFIAVISAVWDHSLGAAKAVGEFSKVIAAHSRSTIASIEPY